MEKDENKQKEAGIGPFLQNKSFTKRYLNFEERFRNTFDRRSRHPMVMLAVTKFSRLIDSAQTTKQINAD